MYLEWGQPAVQNRHVRIDGTTDASWSNLHVYNFQKYSMYAQDTGTASGYINDLQELRTFLAPDTLNQPLPLALTEYNVRTASSYDTRVETLDSPSDYAALGANSVALADQDVRNGTASTNNYGGATKAAEVYRLFNKAAAAGRDRLAFTSDAGTDVRTLVTLDPASKTCFAFITNNSSVAVPLELDLTAMGIPAGIAAIIEEVSENFSGGVSRVAAVSAGKVPTGTLPPQTVWLVSMPTQAHLYGLQDDAWTEATVWSGLSSALRQDAPAGNQISSNTVTAQGTTTRILGQITAGTTAAERQFDVTEFVRSQSDGFASFLIVQDHRWDVALPSLSIGDTQPDGLRISSRETTSGPQLKVFSRQTDAPRIVTQPASQTVTEGQSITFSVAAAGTGPLTYQWRRNGSQIPGAAAATYTIPTASLADTNSRYSVTITNESRPPLAAHSIPPAPAAVSGSWIIRRTPYTSTPAVVHAPADHRPQFAPFR